MQIVVIQRIRNGIRVNKEHNSLHNPRTSAIFFFQGIIRCLNGCCISKTGNAFVTETLPKYTIFCFFTACSGEKIKEVITNSSGVYAVLSVFAFWVHSLGNKLCPFMSVFRLFRKSEVNRFFNISR
jgi:hypothetical protein